MYEFLKPAPSCPPQPLNPHLTFKQSSSCITVNTFTCHGSDPNSPCSSPCTPSRAAQLLRQGLTSSPVSHIDSPSSNARTRGQFKPQRTNKGTTSYQLRQFAEATLGSGSLRKAVKLPEGEDLNEWLAVNGTYFSQAHWESGQLNGLYSGRLLQSDQPALWVHYRVLLSAVLSRDESNR